MHQNKSLGFSANRTQAFVQRKEEVRSKRSSSRSNTMTSQSIDLNTSLSGTGNSVLLQNDSLKHGRPQLASVEMRSFLPPAYVDFYDQANERINQLRLLQKEIVKKQQQRLRVHFGNTDTLDAEIKRDMDKATRLIRECESNLDKIDKWKDEKQSDDPVAINEDLKIRRNLKIALAQQIQEIALQLRQNQKNSYDQLKHFESHSGKGDAGVLGGAPQASGIEKANYGAFVDEAEMQEDGQQVMDDIMLEIANERNEAVNQLVQSINELGQIFKQLSMLVIEQGSLLDRIDVNMEQTLATVKEANKHLTKAKEHQESPLAKRCIQVLFLLIVILTMVLAYRYSRK